MWITNGPTDPNTSIEFTNWEQVDNFGETIKQM
jgi:menaquinone-dependent protoporphyrinogen oxidase